MIAGYNLDLLLVLLLGGTRERSKKVDQVIESSADHSKMDRRIPRVKGLFDMELHV